MGKKRTTDQVAKSSDVKLKLYNGRKSTIFKKAKELSTLCSVDVLVLLYSHNQQSPEIWCNQPHSNVNSIINKFLTNKKTKKDGHDHQDHRRCGESERSGDQVKEERRRAGDEFVGGLRFEGLVDFVRVLDEKIELVNRRINQVRQDELCYGSTSSHDFDFNNFNDSMMMKGVDLGLMDDVKVMAGNNFELMSGRSNQMREGALCYSSTSSHDFDFNFDDCKMNSVDLGVMDDGVFAANSYELMMGGGRSNQVWVDSRYEFNSNGLIGGEVGLIGDGENLEGEMGLMMENNQMWMTAPSDLVIDDCDRRIGGYEGLLLDNDSISDGKVEERNNQKWCDLHSDNSCFVRDFSKSMIGGDLGLVVGEQILKRDMDKRNRGVFT